MQRDSQVDGMGNERDRMERDRICGKRQTERKLKTEKQKGRDRQMEKKKDGWGRQTDGKKERERQT